MTKLDKCLYMIGLAQEDPEVIRDRKYMFIWAENDQECWNFFLEKLLGSREIEASKAFYLARDIMDMTDSCRIVLRENREYSPGIVRWEDEVYVALDTENIKLVDPDYFVLFNYKHEYEKGDLVKPAKGDSYQQPIYRFVKPNPEFEDYFLAQPISWDDSDESLPLSQGKLVSLKYTDYQIIQYPTF